MASQSFLNEIFPKPKPIIGMVHLRPLPGSPLYDPRTYAMRDVIKIAVEEARTLAEAGVDGLQVENIWDYPFVKGEQIGHETTAALTAAAVKVADAVEIPIGINCHLNGGEVALAAAVASGAPLDSRVRVGQRLHLPRWPHRRDRRPARSPAARVAGRRGQVPLRRERQARQPFYHLGPDDCRAGP